MLRSGIKVFDLKNYLHEWGAEALGYKVRQCQGGLSARQGGAYCSATATALQGRALNADRRLNCRQAL